MKIFAFSLFCGALCAQTFNGSPTLDSIVHEAVEKDQIPGAVLVIGHNGQIVYRKAYGNRSLVPKKVPMTPETIFDCASLTKVVATTSAIMKLFEQGKVRLNDRVTEYLPEFQGGKSPITVRQLMTHFSGLRPDVDLSPEWLGYDTGIRLALTDKPRWQPGERFVYSDINFVLLGEIVRRVSGQTLAEFAAATVFRPLGMTDTMFQPSTTLRDRIAPTEPAHRGESPLQGVVHDPTSRFMGGIAGHAGLFSTGDDLARFAEMMVSRGEWQGQRIFGAGTVEKFTTPQTPPNQPILRGLGWDIDSPYSSNRGELFPLGSYGHTGFTGTSMWLDPSSHSYVILLTNAVHPYRRPTITSLRARVATAAAAAIGVQAPAGVTLTGYNETLVGAGGRREVARNGDVQTGLDVLIGEKFSRFQGKRIGLITNQTGLDRDGNRSVDKMVESGVKVTAMFSPEHGIFGVEDQENIENSRDTRTGIRVWSLYDAERRRPTAAMLRDIDLLVFDIQDIGARFYTYVSTMAITLEEAARHKIPYMVLDRPNPITGVHVEGPVMDPENESFVGYFPMPVRHGMTMGEMARMINGERKLGANLEVVEMKGWERGDWFDSTGLRWSNPSPNMRSLNAAILYPGVALLEASKNYSVGRGTDAPFEWIGAPFLSGLELSRYLNERKIPGIRTYAVKFRPESSNLAGAEIPGVRFVITDREQVDAGRLGLELAAALQKLYPDKIDFETNRRLIGSSQAITALKAGDDPRSILQAEQDRIDAFLATRAKYLIYQ